MMIRFTQMYYMPFVIRLLQFSKYQCSMVSEKACESFAIIAIIILVSMLRSKQVKGLMYLRIVAVQKCSCYMSHGHEKTINVTFEFGLAREDISSIFN